MLSFEVDKTGGVEIRGTKDELLNLIVWLLLAALKGHSEPSYVSDLAFTSIKIVCEKGG
jgi:hypothetical protein